MPQLIFFFLKRPELCYRTTSIKSQQLDLESEASVHFYTQLVQKRPNPKQGSSVIIKILISKEFNKYFTFKTLRQMVSKALVEFLGASLLRHLDQMNRFITMTL